MKRLKKLARMFAWLLVSAAVGVGALAAASYVVSPKNNQVEFGQIDAPAHGVMGERAQSIDVLFLGDSEAYRSFVPLQLWGERGIASYVCATSGQHLPYTRSLLCRALERQRPRVVVLETHCIFASFSASEEVGRIMQDIFPVFEYHDRWKSLSAQDLTAPVRCTWTDPLKGYRLSSASDIKAADTSGYMAPTDDRADLPSHNRRLLEEIKSLCDAAGARLVLVSAPSTVNWSMAHHNRMVQVAAEMGVDYWDLNAGSSAVSIDWSRDTYDAGDHLNLAGAQKVSAWIGSLLRDTYQIPDHRGDGAYDSWDEAYASYASRLASEQVP